MAVGHFLVGSHNFMVTALGSCGKWLKGPLHTRDGRPVTSASQDLSLVEKVEAIQVHFTLEGEGLNV